MAGLTVLWEGRLVLWGAAQLGGRQCALRAREGGVWGCGEEMGALTGKGIDQILRKTIAKACCCRRIGVTSWLAETVAGA